MKVEPDEYDSSELEPPRISRRDMERMQRAIHKALEKQGHKSVEEMNAWLEEFVNGRRMEEILAECEEEEEDPSEVALDLVEEALEEDDAEAAIDLVERALVLDPLCMDALILRTTLTGMSENEALASFQEALSDHEEEIGPEFFEENKGIFWGLLETRPYMQLRAFVMDRLREVGQLPEAIRHCEAMLELNPNDNQGVRDCLLSMYLETDDLPGARRLFEQYKEDTVTAMFNYGRVLERFLSDNLEEADKAFRHAVKNNPHAPDYLTGKRRMPKEDIEFYGMGDKREAVFCCSELGSAWRKHPKAVEWLKDAAKNLKKKPERKKQT